MNKRGQITLFVIIAILLVGAISVFLLFRTGVIQAPVSAEEAQKIVSAQSGSIRDYTEGCMEAVVYRTINTLGRQGGYIWPRGDRYSIPYDVFPDSPAMTYALIKEESSYKNFFPTLTEMKDEFVSVMEANPDFDSCIDNFKNFRKILDIEYGDMKIDRENLDFGEKSGQIVVPFTYPVTISKQDAKTLVDDYQINIPINLAKIQENAVLIINQKASGKSITLLMQEQAKTQEFELRENPDGERILLTSKDFEMVPTGTDAEGKTFNLKNTLFTVTYSNPSLTTPYNFYFLVGE